MNLERSEGPNLLPDKFDAGLLGEYEELYLSETERLPDELRKVLFWTLRLSLWKDETKHNIEDIPGFRFLSIGFHDPDTEEDGFGFVLYTASTLDKHAKEMKYRPSYVEIDGNAFSIVVRSIFETQHQNKSNPPGGTGACWATSRVGGINIGPGILTAKHVVGTTLGSQIALSCGCTGVLEDVAPDGIDAALVTSPCSQSANRLVPRQLIAPWTDVYFDGGSSGRVVTKVSDVTDTKGILDHSALPSRVFLAQPGRAGDSGALVRELNSGDPVGIYIGAFSTPANQSGGIAQHAYQAEQLMDMEMHQ